MYPSSNDPRKINYTDKISSLSNNLKDEIIDLTQKNNPIEHPALDKDFA